MKPSEPERFWSKVDRGGPDDCWNWTACAQREGYGRFMRRGRVWQATHVAWELHHGAPPPKGALVCHRCDNPRCVNPAHLFIGTHLDNRRDCVAKGRARGGEGDRNPMRLYPEKRQRGDAHWTRRMPDRVLRGEAHWHFGKGKGA